MKELIAIQSELKAPKNQFNNFGKYKYRSQEDILEAVKPLLAKHQCALMLTDEVKHAGSFTYIEATARLYTTYSDGVEICQFVEVKAQAGVQERKGMDLAQSFGASSSYARKYALNGLFLIDDTKDADATNTHGKDEEEAPRTTLYNHKELGNNEKPLISNVQFKRLYERVKAGEYELIDKAQESFSFAPEQLKKLQSINQEV